MKKSNILLILIFITSFIFFSYCDVSGLMDKFVDKTFNATGDLITDAELALLKDSGVEFDNYSFDSEFYPYYAMLDDNEKELYKQVYANAVSLETTFIPAVDIKINDVNDVIISVFYDHPELFWINTNYGYKYTLNKKCCQIILEFNYLTEDIEYYKGIFDSKVNYIINESLKYKTIYEKELFVHDKIIELSVYDETDSINQSAYSALIDKRSVCAGYSRAFQYIMIKLGIPTYYVTGGEDHAWNMIKLEDEYYNVDVTWDDMETTSHNLFNFTDKEYDDHNRVGLSVNLPKCNGTKYKYKVPVAYSKNSVDIDTYVEIDRRKRENKYNNIDESYESIVLREIEEKEKKEKEIQNENTQEDNLEDNNDLDEVYNDIEN